jgi:hypothetical protein
LKLKLRPMITKYYTKPLYSKRLLVVAINTGAF